MNKQEAELFMSKMEQGVEKLKGAGDVYIINPLTGEKILVNYETAKSDLNDMKLLIGGDNDRSH